MSLPAALANTAWLTLSAPACRRYEEALLNPATAQWRILRTSLARHASSAYGRAHDFRGIRSPAEFAQRVPLVGYEELEPWITRIQAGESSVLTGEAVTRLLPTSGSSGARKLIPYTASLQNEFNAAVAPWMRDLVRHHPSIRMGSAYWSVTPITSTAGEPPSAVPVGFEDDSQYLGGARAWLVEKALAVPSSVRHIPDLTAFRHAILLCLLRRADLRLISVWHPSFLSLLLDALPVHWDSLMSDLNAGTFCYADRLSGPVSASLRLRPDRRAVQRLSRMDPARPETLWPALCVVSCWADGHAAGAAEEIRRRLPHARVQPKGLLATEAFVTLPFAGQQPLAVCSHYYEFLDARGVSHPAEALVQGTVYEIVVTTGGGLWRYRLGDLVEVTGFVGQTPSLRFLGRAGRISDLRGEKLNEAFVARVIHEVFAPQSVPAFAMLAPVQIAGEAHYTLYLQAVASPDLAPRLDLALRANPHYALCRDLQQLGPAEILSIADGAYEVFAAAEMARGLRLGDIKPVALSLQSDWSQRFPRR